MQDAPLTDKTALVTGATSGIGHAVALQLARDGANIIVHGRDADRGEAVVGELVAIGVEARFISADLADAGGVASLAEQAADVDILVNAAGIYAFTPTAATDVASFDRHFAVNTRAPFLLVAAIAPRMAARGHGTIVTISSSAATVPAPVGSAYGASKAAVELLTRSWAMEFGASGVRVNAVSPGPVVTGGTEEMLGDYIGMLGRGTIRGRAADPDEIASVVAFLAGPGSSYINGSIVLADGGAVSAMPS